MIRDILILFVVSIIYSLILFFIAPIVDHAFSPLHKEETNIGNDGLKSICKGMK